MLGIGCPDRHALRRITPSKMHRDACSPPARAGSFFGAWRSFDALGKQAMPMREQGPPNA
jgi:hypothetical protein